MTLNYISNTYSIATNSYAYIYLKNSYAYIYLNITEFLALSLHPFYISD